METLRCRLNPDYMIAGREKGGENGRLHFQGYMEFKKRKLGSAVDSAFRKTFPLPISCHYDLANGSAAQNLEYCSKEDKDPFLFGEPTGNEGQGTRSDLGAMFEMVKTGANDEELIQSDAAKWAVHRKALSEYRLLIQPKRTFPSKLIFLWGPTGTGKTMHAQELSPQPINWRNPFMTGYNGANKNVLFDDFNWQTMDPKFWLTMCDRYPLTVEIKGNSLNWAPENIIFTSNDDPMTWWPEAPEQTLQAIHRRMREFGEIQYLGELVPKTQALLSRYLRAEPAPNAASDAATGVVDLCENSDDDSCAPPLKRARTIRCDSDYDDE